MSVYLLALKNRLDNGDITQEVYDSIAIELAESVVETVEVVDHVPIPTLEERLQALEAMELERILGGM